jgi:hypothetical protein
MSLDEYLRRNLLHASAVGCMGNAKASLKRLRARKTPAPLWLIRSLEGIAERAERVAREMAVHRDEAKP